jgi:hypothetical protein
VLKYIFLKDREVYEMIARNAKVRSNDLNTWYHVEKISLPDKKKVKVKQSRYRPGVAQRVPGS